MEPQIPQQRDIGAAPQEPQPVLRVSEDRLVVAMDCEMAPSDMDEFITGLSERLSSQSISERFLGDEFKDNVRAAFAKGVPVKGAVIVKALPPKPPVQGVVKWHGDFFRRGFEIDERTGALDYRRPLAKKDIQAGQHLATVMPPIPGEDGLDLFGKFIRADKTKAFALRPAGNVEQREPGQFYAVKSGRIRFAEGGLAVDDVVRINGNVGLRTGHLKHSGAIVVTGDIDPGCEVTCDGDLDVQGIVEQATIRVGGNLTVQGGILGKGVCTIKVAGNLHARFVAEADIETAGDVVVEREVLHCMIRTRGALRVDAGRVVGGEIWALGGVLASQIGAEAVVQTILHPGKDYLLQGQLEALLTEIEELETRRAKILKTVEPLLARKAQLKEESKLALGKLTHEADELHKKALALDATVQQFREESKGSSRPIAQANNRMYPETLIRMGKDQMRIRGLLEGPAYARLLKGLIRLKRGSVNWEKKPIPEAEEPEDNGDQTDDITQA